MKTPIQRKVSVLVVLFFVSFLGTAQSIANFKMSTNVACASPKFNEYDATFDVNDGVFANDNKFILEISDLNGEFNENTQVLATLNTFDENTDFENFDIPVPSGVGSYGSDQFKVRMRATSPADTAVVSSFEFFWYDTTLEAIVLNGYNDLEICPGTNYPIQVQQENHRGYIWLRNGEIMEGENASSLIVIHSGTYQVFIDLGSCNPTDGTTGSYANAKSNKMTITVKPAPDDITSTGTMLCEGSSVTVSATELRTNEYQWLKDNVQIPGATQYELVVSEPGKYQCSIIKQGCTTVSNAITVGLFDTESIQFSPAGPIELVTGQSVAITVTGGDAYRWTNAAGEQISTADQLVVTQGGTYTVEAVRNGVLCSVIKSITVNEVAPSDSDSDGVYDTEDECPDTAGLPEFNGCPDPDSDDDGVNDYNDDCPDEAGPENNNGCPVSVVDTDGDGVADADDDCRLTIGLPEFNGCPDDEGQTPPSSSEVVSKALTMNGDGVNDQWVLPAKYAGQPEVEVIIFAPTGEIVLKTKNYRNTWPEEALNSSKTTEFYYYIIRSEKEILKKGTITVIK